MSLIRRLRDRWPDLAALTLLAAAAAWLFRLHITRQVVFIGNSDRLNTMFNILSFYTENFRHGRIGAWNQTMFAGFNALALPYTFPTPLAWLESLAGREQLLYVAGLVACGLLAAAGWAAYAFIRDVTGHAFASFVGAVLYMFCALTTLKVSQNDMSFAVLIVIPLMMLLLRRIRPGRTLRCFLGLAMLFACLLSWMFLQKAAYCLMLGGGYALYLALGRRDWRPVVVAGAAFLVGLTAAAPRVYTVGEEMKLAQRSDGLPYQTVLEYYRHVRDAERIPVYSSLRWFEDGLFGRYPAEGREGLNGHLNLNEGMLLYTSAFTVFVLLAGLGLFRRRWWLLTHYDDEGASYLFWFLMLGVGVLTLPPVMYVMYRLFFRWDFYHARILVACVLPLATLTALVVRELTGRLPAGVSRGRAALAAALALGAGAALLWAGGAVGRAGGSWILVPGSVPTTQVLGGPVCRVGFALGVLAALGCVRLYARQKPALRWATGVLLGLLLVFDAALGANFRLNGPQNRPSANPYGGDNMLLADPGTFTAPSAPARKRFAERLETGRFRSVVIGEQGKFPPVCASHLSQFWGLELLDGYMSGVPRVLAALPFPGENCNNRTITFTLGGPMPFHILALLNVKYALVVNRGFYANRVRSRDGGWREAYPCDVAILQNPVPVVPRYFFPARVEAVADIDEAVARIFPRVTHLTDLRQLVNDVRQTSFVEGPGPEQLPPSGGGGRVSVYGGGDRLDIAVDPAAEPRFLVLNERWHPRWHARAGSQEIPIYRTNAVMRGLVIPPGVGHVTLRFTPFVFSRAALAFYATALLLLGAGSWLWRRQDRAAGTLAADGAGSAPPLRQVA